MIRFSLPYFFIFSLFGCIVVAESAQSEEIEKLYTTAVEAMQSSISSRKKENFHQAIEKCEKLNRMYPDNAYRDEMEIMIAECYAHTGQIEKAKQVYRAFQQRSPEGFERYSEERRKVVAKQPKDSAKMAVIHQDNATNPKQKNLEALYQAAEKAIKASDWNDAIAKYQLLNSKYPHSAHYLIELHAITKALYAVNRSVSASQNNPDLAKLTKLGNFAKLTKIRKILVKRASKVARASVAKDGVQDLALFVEHVLDDGDNTDKLVLGGFILMLLLLYKCIR